MIVLVEDDLSIQKLVSYALEMNGFSVACFSSGEEALKCDKDNIQLYILDIMLPGLSGLEILSHIRGDKRTKNIPVILLTAKSTELDKVTGLDSGADDYLTKPFQMAELLARIRALTRRSKSIPSLEIGNIKLLEGDYTITALKSIKLTNKEYKLMELLIHNKNIYLNSDRILEAIWDIDDDIDVNVLFVFISNLRKKLEQIGANYTIKSKRGIGYRLEPAINKSRDFW